MKKLLVTMLTILTCGAVYALPVGNPADPILLTQGLWWDDCYEDECIDPCDPCGWDWDFSLRFGYYGDFVYNRDLELDDEGANLEHAEIWTNAGLIVLNIWDRVDVFATLGGTEMYFDGRAADFGILGTERLSIETDTDFSWSVGARAVLWECGCTAIGLEAQYFHTHPDVRRVSFADITTIYPDDDADLRYHEWQVGLGIAHRINMFVPYFAVKWSKAKFDLDVPIVPGIITLEPDFESRHHWGYAFGVSLVDCDIMSLNVEGRLRDEKAIAVNAQIRF